MDTIIKKWVKVGNGIQNPVNCIFVYNNELYVIGEFTNIGNVQVSNIAKWNGESWLPVIEQITGTINYGCVFQNELYLAGNFTSINSSTYTNIIKYNGSDWGSIGSISKEIFKLKIENNRLFALCQFNDTENDGVFELTGNTWGNITFNPNILGESSNTNKKINDIVYYQNQYYLAKGTCTSLCEFENNLVTGGLFYTLNGNNIIMNDVSNTVLKQFNGSTWSLLGGGIPTKLNNINLDSQITSLIVYEDEFNNSLYVAGNFNRINSTNRNLGDPTISINRWNGEVWQNLGYTNSTIKIRNIFGYTNNDTDSQIRNGIYIGGLFASLPDIYSNNIAVYSTQTDEDLDVFLNPTSDTKCEPIVPCGFAIERPPSTICQTGTLIPGPPGPQGQPGPPGPPGNDGGTTYTEGPGINIVNDVISVDTADIAGYGLTNNNNKIDIVCDDVVDCVTKSSEGSPINIVCEQLHKRGTTYIVFLRKDLEELALYNDPLDYNQWITPDEEGCDSILCVGGDNDPPCCGQNGGSAAIQAYWPAWDGAGNPNTLPTTFDENGDTIVDVSQIVPGSMVMDLANRIYFLPNPEFTNCVPECDYYSGTGGGSDPGPGETDFPPMSTDGTDIISPSCNIVILNELTYTNPDRIDELGVNNGFNPNPGPGKIKITKNNPIDNPSWCWVSFVTYPDGSTNDNWIILGDDPDTNGFDYMTGTVDEFDIQNELRFSIPKMTRNELYQIIQGTCEQNAIRTGTIVVALINDNGDIDQDSMKEIDIEQCVTGCSACTDKQYIYADKNGYIILYKKPECTGCLITNDCVVNTYLFDNPLLGSGIAFNSKEFETSSLTPYDCCNWKIKTITGFEVTFDTEGNFIKTTVGQDTIDQWINLSNITQGVVNSDTSGDDPKCSSDNLPFTFTPFDSGSFVREIEIEFEDFAAEYTTTEKIYFRQFPDIDITSTDFNINNPDYLINYYNV